MVAQLGSVGLVTKHAVSESEIHVMHDSISIKVNFLTFQFDCLKSYLVREAKQSQSLHDRNNEAAI